MLKRLDLQRTEKTLSPELNKTVQAASHLPLRQLSPQAVTDTDEADSAPLELLALATELGLPELWRHENEASPLRDSWTTPTLIGA